MCSMFFVYVEQFSVCVCSVILLMETVFYVFVCVYAQAVQFLI